jgi:hypothetical protein
MPMVCKCGAFGSREYALGQPSESDLREKWIMLSLGGELIELSKGL